MYEGYLIHYNKNHDPKSGRFTFAIGGDKISTYNGQKKSEYKKEMTTKYMDAGNSKMKSKMYAKGAISSNRQATQQYNLNLKRNQKYAEKAREADVLNDREKYDKYTTKLNRTYRDAMINKYIIDHGMEFGKAVADLQLAQFVGGIAATTAVAYQKGGYNDLYNQAKSFVEDQMSKSTSPWIGSRGNSKKDTLDDYARREGFKSWDDVPDDHWLRKG